MSTAKTITVVGLGYIGLPLATLLADAGFRVHGVDINPARVAAVNAGAWPLDPDEYRLPELLLAVVSRGALTASTVYEAANIAIVCVPTPADERGAPDLEPLRSALDAINPPPELLIVESTLPPGTMRHEVEPRFPGTLLAHCPERVMPGWLYHNLRTVPRVIGGVTREAEDMAKRLYCCITNDDVELHRTDAATAEVVKCAENAYRYVQIAFANELALICESAGVDAWRVRDLVNTAPNHDVLRPGPGAGGPCLSKDTRFLLRARYDGPGIADSCLSGAISVNTWMPWHVAGLVNEALREAGAPTKPIVAILGTAYKADTSDQRNSPVGELVKVLHLTGVEECVFHDPNVPQLAGPLIHRLSGADAAVILAGHREYLGLDWDHLGAVMRHRVLVDARGVVWPPPEGFVFRGVGRGRI